MFWNVLEIQGNGKKKYVKSFSGESDSIKKEAQQWAIDNCTGSFELTLTDICCDVESFDDISQELKQFKGD